MGVDDWRQANRQLRDALAEAGWTGQQLATAVNIAGRETGVMLSYDRTAVAHWLAGTQPRSPVPELLAEALSRRLGRLVNPRELGLLPPAGAAGLPTQAGASYSRRALSRDLAQIHNEDALSALAALADSRAVSGQTAGQPAYSLAALTLPGWSSEAMPLPLRANPADGAPARLTAASIASAEHMARLCRAYDAAFGGSYARPAAAWYLAELTPKLRAAVPPARQRRLLTAATEIAHLCAFMCFDDGLHGLSQRYYRAALALAAENGDQAAYAITLRAMSAQAYSLGHSRESRRLAESAAESTRRLEPVYQAFVLGQLAVARAADGDGSGALVSLTAVERRLHQAATATRPIGGYHRASLAYQQAVVRSLLGDQHGAIAALCISIRHRPVTERRSRAITLASLAELQLSVGHLDEAVQTWHQFLDDYPYLRSGRVTAAFQMLRRRIRPHSRNAAARTLMQRAAAQAALARADQLPDTL
jgi:transcriptional regulator with XRE-family HTH domain